VTSENSRELSPCGVEPRMLESRDARKRRCARGQARADSSYSFSTLHIQIISEKLKNFIIILLFRGYKIRKIFKWHSCETVL